jgi:hypothetical protein
MTLSSQALWAEWKRITRFLNSTQIALARERLLWESLELDRASDTRLHVPAEKGEYVVRLDEHLESLATLTTLHAAVPIQSYAVAEAAACDRLGLDQRAAGGIEEWGQALLAANDRTWADVHGAWAAQLRSQLRGTPTPTQLTSSMRRLRPGSSRPDRPAGPLGAGSIFNWQT